jgi:methyltransferase (TIGR00027 family)
MPDTMAARTWFFDDFFRDATKAGIRQAVILASGLDSRAYRLAWPAEMTLFEIDQPEVIEFKATTLAGLGAAPQTDLRTVAIDLRHDWPTALLDAGLDKSRPTAWIAEGLFGYLPPEAQDALLENITALSAPGSRFACEAVPARPEIDKEKAREKMRKASAKWREHGLEMDFTELGFQGERNDVGAHLQDLGWQTTGTPMRQLLADHHLATVPRNPDGVSVADTVYYTSKLDK